MMKILVIGDSESVHVRRWIIELEKRGLRTLLVSSPHFRGAHTFWRRAARTVLLFWKALFSTLSFRPDIVHAHFISSYGVIASLLPTRRLVVSVWGSDVLIAPWKSRRAFLVARWVLRRASLVFADSSELVEVSRRIDPFEGKYVLVNWGVDLIEVSESRHDSDEIKFISVRHIDPIYNVIEAVTAFSEAAARSTRKVSLDVFGGGYMIEELKALIPTLACSELIRYHGKVGPARILEALSESDVMVTVPSSDGTAASLLEGMAAGLYVICSDIPANREWVGDGSGIFVKPGDVAELKKAFLKAFEMSADSLKESGSRNRAVIRSKADRGKQFDFVVKCYVDLLAGAVPGTRIRNLDVQ